MLQLQDATSQTGFILMRKTLNVALTSLALGSYTVRFQHDRVLDPPGPSSGQSASAPNAGFEERSNRGGRDGWHRAGREDQEGTIQSQQAQRTEGKDAGDLASRPCCIIRITLNRGAKRSNLARPRICTNALRLVRQPQCAIPQRSPSESERRSAPSIIPY
jgi:hypothetical protein